MTSVALASILFSDALGMRGADSEGLLVFSERFTTALNEVAFNNPANRDSLQHFRTIAASLGGKELRQILSSHASIGRAPSVLADIKVKLCECSAQAANMLKQLANSATNCLHTLSGMETMNAAMNRVESSAVKKGTTSTLEAAFASMLAIHECSLEYAIMGAFESLQKGTAADVAAAREVLQPYAESLASSHSLRLSLQKQAYF